MKITQKDINDFDNIINPIISNQYVQKMKTFTQHGGTSTYNHCKNISLICFKLNRKFNLKCNEKDLVIGAMLHDFYLYDWHIDKTPSRGLHGFVHPLIAEENANKHFNINNKIKNIIISHMWPLTLTRLPMSREAWLVSCIDKFCSTTEVIKNFYKNIK
jgi:uncharacterized protein